VPACPRVEAPSALVVFLAGLQPIGLQPFDLFQDLCLLEHPLPFQHVINASSCNAWARAISSSGTACLRPSAFAILTFVLFRVIVFPLLDQPGLDEPAKASFPHRDGLRFQGRQEVCEFVLGDVDPLGEVYEDQGVLRLGRAGANLGNRGVEIGQQGGRDLVAFDRLCDAVEELRFEGFGGVRHTASSFLPNLFDLLEPGHEVAVDGIDWAAQLRFDDSDALLRGRHGASARGKFL
jgi:hypothetical protein